MSARTDEVPGTLRPSNAPQWGPGGCPGSFYMQQQFPENPETEKARQGTAAHWVAMEGLHGRRHPVGFLTPNGVPVDQEMMDGADVYIRDVLGETATLSPEGRVFVETKVFGHKTVHPDNEGTADCNLIDPTAKRYVGWDFKYGHRGVHPFRNWQIVDYMLCALETAGFSFEDVHDWSFSLRIVQPRDYKAEPVKTWEITGAQLPPLLFDLKAAAIAAKTRNAPCIPGDYCGDCTAAHACPALRAVGGYAMDIAGESTPEFLDNEGIGLELRAITRAMKRLEARKTGLEEVAIAKIQMGERLPHWTLGRGDTREKWVSAADEVFMMGDLMGVNLRKEPEPITPNQARKAGVDATIVATYAQKPAGAVKLLPADASDAAKAFS